MCYYRLYIFAGCGHSTFSETPISYCQNARTKTKKNSISTMKQHKDVTPAAGDEGPIESDSKSRDSQMTLVPDDELIERTERRSICRDSPQSSRSIIEIGEDKTQHPSPAPTTDVFQSPNTDDGTAPSHTSMPTIIPKAKTSSPNRPGLDTHTIELACEEGRVHPLHTIRLDRMCAVCEQEREERLRLLYSSMTKIRVDPSRWYCKYQGDVRRKGDGEQQIGAGWGVVMGGWWDRGKKGDKEDVT
jgi:hypothetical protein